MTARVVGTLAFLLLLPVTAGCAPTDIKWTEEVKLHDGKVIPVKRRTQLSSSGFPSQTRGHPRYHELCYAPLGVYWKSKAVYRPEAFDIVGGKAYVRVPLRGCTSCMHHGYPQTNSIYFAWDGKQWNKVDEKQAPGALRFNLLSKTHVEDDGARDARGLVTVADKEERDSGIYSDLRRGGARSPSEMVPVRDLCQKCKGIPTKTSTTADVFEASGGKSCSW